MIGFHAEERDLLAVDELLLLDHLHQNAILNKACNLLFQRYQARVGPPELDAAVRNPIPQPLGLLSHVLLRGNPLLPGLLFRIPHLLLQVLHVEVQLLLEPLLALDHALILLGHSGLLLRNATLELLHPGHRFFQCSPGRFTLLP